MEIEITVPKGTEVKIVCPNCDGQKKLKYIDIDDPDDTVMLDCSMCDGEGIIKGRLAEDFITYHNEDDGDLLEDMDLQSTVNEGYY